MYIKFLKQKVKILKIIALWLFLKLNAAKITLFCGPFGCRQKINRKCKNCFGHEETMDDVNGIGWPRRKLALTSAW